MPLHPIFVHFPIALIIVGFFADCFGFSGRNPRGLIVGWTCLLLGLIGTLAAILSGINDLHAADLNETSKRLAQIHLRTGLLLGFLLLALTVWRAWLHNKAAERRALPFMIVYAFAVGLLGFQGWYGGELAYSHGAGGAASGQGMVAPERAKQRLETVADQLEQIPGLRPRPIKTSPETSPPPSN